MEPKVPDVLFDPEVKGPDKLVLYWPCSAEGWDYCEDEMDGEGVCRIPQSRWPGKLLTMQDIGLVVLPEPKGPVPRPHGMPVLVLDGGPPPRIKWTSGEVLLLLLVQWVIFAAIIARSGK